MTSLFLAAAQQASLHAHPPLFLSQSSLHLFSSASDLARQFKYASQQLLQVLDDNVAFTVKFPEVIPVASTEKPVVPFCTFPLVNS